MDNFTNSEFLLDSDENLKKLIELFEKQLQVDKELEQLLSIIESQKRP